MCYLFIILMIPHLNLNEEDLLSSYDKVALVSSLRILDCMSSFSSRAVASDLRYWLILLTTLVWR
jgi:hypothetical protein